MVVEKTGENLKRLIRSFDLWASECTKEKTWYHYASDEQGSTVFVADDDEVKNRYEYDAWGNAVVCEEAVENRYRYTGQQFDPVTQQYYLRVRYYNPVIARFTQEDVYRGDGLNLYAYCDNNPVMYYDPSGYACDPGTKDAVGKAVDSKSSRNKPKEHGTPNSTEFIRNKEGNIEKYTTYGADGKIVKEVRITGKEHGNIPRPNVKEPSYNVNPNTGEKFQNGYNVRPIRADELPKNILN